MKKYILVGKYSILISLIIGICITFLVYFLFRESISFLQVLLLIFFLITFVWLAFTGLKKIVNILHLTILHSKISTTSQQGIIILNKNFQTIYVNKSAEQITGYTKKELLGKNPDDIISAKKNNIEKINKINKIKKSGNLYSYKKIDITNIRKNGEEYIVEIYGNHFINRKNKSIFIFSAFNDVTETRKTSAELKEANRKLHLLSSIDGLTSIANRRIFDETLKLEWNNCMQNSLPLSLIIYDIDFFKKYNDTYGHLEGDEVLKRVSTTLKNICANYKYLVARFGGEEFAVIMSNVISSDAYNFAEKGRNAIYELLIPHKSSDISKFITLSGGISTIIPKPNDDINNLIKQADEALYTAKTSGRNKIQKYHSTIKVI